jgi:hypothetical protein
MGPLEIRRSRHEELCVIHKTAEPAIAVVANHAAKFSRGMIVINMQSTLILVRLPATNLALAVVLVNIVLDEIWVLPSAGRSPA